jgi:hypothetical protein
LIDKKTIKEMVSMARKIITRKNEEIIVDEKNYDFLNKFTWHIDTNGYPRTSVKTEDGYKKVRMHKMIIPNTDESKRIDHKDQNKLNNTEENFRVCSHGQNMMNKSIYSNKESSIFKGVYGKKYGDKDAFEVRIGLNGRDIRLGTYSNEEAGANAYNYYARLIYGDFASLNEVEYMSKNEWREFQGRRSKLSRVGTWIMTYVGNHFYPLDPRIEDIDKVDIAHSLSNYARFTGHTREFYSVGTHSILCAESARKDGMSTKIQLYCLLHDGSEAYLGDIARPLKELLPNYVAMEEEVQACVFEHFGLPQPTDEEWRTVKHYDDYLLANEIGQLMINAEEFGIEPIYDGIVIPRYSNVHVKNRFLEILEFLLKDYKEEIGNE